MNVTLTFDDHEWQEFIAAWQEPAVRKTLKAAASAWGRKAKPILKAETPVAKPGNPYAKGEGNLRDLTRYKQIGAQYGIGVVVAPMGRGAYYRRWVVGGTKAHVILPKSTGGRLAVLGGLATAVHHPGARANDYVSRAFPQAEFLGGNAAEDVIFAGLEAQRIAETVDDI